MHRYVKTGEAVRLWLGDAPADTLLVVVTITPRLNTNHTASQHQSHITGIPHTDSHCTTDLALLLVFILLFNST